MKCNGGAIVSVAKKLADVRNKVGMSLRQTGEKAGISYARLSLIENQKTSISFDDLIKLCGAYGVSSVVESEMLRELKMEKSLAS
jgi:transcriptional regulator with XRE-family HTH domain